MSWHCITLTHDDIMSGKWAPIQDSFEEIFTRLGAPKNAAMFCRDEAGGGVSLIFSPKASEITTILLSANGGKPCEKPPAKDTTLLVGNGDPVRELLGP